MFKGDENGGTEAGDDEGRPKPKIITIIINVEYIQKNCNNFLRNYTIYLFLQRGGRNTSISCKYMLRDLIIKCNWIRNIRDMKWNMNFWWCHFGIFLLWYIPQSILSGIFFTINFCTLQVFNKKFLKIKVNTMFFDFRKYYIEVWSCWKLICFPYLSLSLSY